jgi:N-methylhydantoinase B/oxoprolinase/acetone carboxylase alpha subunit
VLNDVIDGYITQEIAERVYGVVMAGNPLEIDVRATERLRKKG